MSWISLLLMPTLLWQEPEPQPSTPPPAAEQPDEQEPAPQEPGTQEPTDPQGEGDEDRAASPEEIAEAIEKVRQSFADLDKSLLAARDTAEQVAEEAETGNVGERFVDAVADADQLLNDMEELLAMLPSSDSPPSPQSSPSGNGPSKGEQEPQQQDGNRPFPLNEAEGNQGDPNDGDNEDGQDQEPLKVLPIFMKPGQGGAWGHLPPRLQQTLENAQAEDLPLRYRNLLEQYYRKSNDQ